MHSGELGNFLSETASKIQAGRQALVEIGRRRALIAFDAHHRGDAEAKAELAELAARIPVIEAELSDLEAARTEASRRLDEALAVERRERQIARARESLEAIEKAKEAAVAVDAAAEAFSAGVKAYDAALDAIRAIGVVTEFSAARPTFIEFEVIQGTAPNKQLTRGLAGQGTRCIELAKRLALPGAAMRLLHEADQEG